MRILLTILLAALALSPAMTADLKLLTAGAYKSAALELVRYGILVNAIVPGPFLTKLTTPQLKEMFERGSPMHRVATTEEIQGLALFLASPASSYITGTHMVIDGGAMLGRAD